MIGAGRGWTRAGAALLAVAVLMASGCRDRSDPDPTPRSYGKVLEPATTGAEADPEADDDADLERIVELQIEKAGADGRWRGYRTHANDETLTDVQRAQVAQLEALGYVTGTVSPPEAAGITVHDRERAHAGLNLLTSGHGQVAQLMDMDGRVLHEWTADFWAIWPDYPAARHVSGNEYFRRVHLFDDGSLLAIYEGLGIIKLDKDSNVLWANPCRAHHDLHVQPDGIIAVLTREAHVLPRINPARPVLEDFVTLLGPDGEERSRLSLLECFENSERHRRVLVGLGQKKTLDLFHTNAIRVLDGALADTHPAFAAGNYLISCCRLDRIAVVDPAAREVIWTLRDDWHRHHDPDLLPGGHLLIFDNRGQRGRSRVLEYDLAAPSEPVWQYQGTAEQPFYTHTCGEAQRLPGGTTLIVESDNGRAFEVTPDGTIVWEFVSPHRAGENGQFIASLPQLQRLPLPVPDWHDGGGG